MTSASEGSADQVATTRPGRHAGSGGQPLGPHVLTVIQLVNGSDPALDTVLPATIMVEPQEDGVGRSALRKDGVLHPLGTTAETVIQRSTSR